MQNAYNPKPVGRDNSISTVACYRLDGPGIGSWWGRDFQHTSRLALGPTQPPIQGGPGLALGRVKQLGHGADHPPPCSAEVKERVKLYICSPSGPLWLVLQGTFTLTM